VDTNIPENVTRENALAMKNLTKPGAGLLPGPVTMDVDIGVTLAAEGGQYGTIADDLTGQGFRRDENNRYLRQFETMPVFIDFLTEHPTATNGSVMVDGVPTGIFPGVDRAFQLQCSEYTSSSCLQIHARARPLR